MEVACDSNPAFRIPLGKAITSFFPLTRKISQEHFETNIFSQQMVMTSAPENFSKSSVKKEEHQGKSLELQMGKERDTAPGIWRVRKN